MDAREVKRGSFTHTWRVMTKEGMRIIATCEDEHEARLIAAAPELLEALRHCLAVLDNVYVDLLLADSNPALGLINSRQNARAAINKAEGK